MENIVCQNLNFYYGENHVLEDINVTLKEGSYTLIVGPNGAGKSTFLRLIGGLLVPHSGDLFIGDKSALALQQQGALHLVPQIYNKNAAQFPATVGEVVELGLIRTFRDSERIYKNKKSIIKEALALVQMEDMIEQRIGNLSGGQQQRVVLAQALVRRPKYLLLDEPTSGIDFATSQYIFNLLSILQKEYEMTILLVTHDVNEAAKEAEQVLCINRHLCYFGDTAGFLEKHMHTALSWHIGG